MPHEVLPLFFAEQTILNFNLCSTMRKLQCRDQHRKIQKTSNFCGAYKSHVSCRLDVLLRKYSAEHAWQKADMPCNPKRVVRVCKIE
jgi:hypothetical protein